MTWYRAGMTLLTVGVLGSACGEAFTGTGPDGTTTGSGGVNTSATAATAAAGGEMSGTTSTGSHATGGSGGRGCFTCDEAIQAPTKLQPGLVCDGDEKADYTSFIECLCTVNGTPLPCLEACADYCAELGELSQMCRTCIGADSACKTPYEDCQEVSR